MDLQAAARAHRIGQQREVLVIRLETAGTVEELIRARADRKRAVAARSIDGGCFDGETTAAERASLLEEILTSTRARAEARRPPDGTGAARLPPPCSSRPTWPMMKSSPRGRPCVCPQAAPEDILSDQALNALIARSPEEAALFDKQARPRRRPPLPRFSARSCAVRTRSRADSR